MTAPAHAMTERADSDPIVDAELFPVPANISVPGLEGLAYAHLAKMYSKHAQATCEEVAPLPELPLAWGSRGDLQGSARYQQEGPPDAGVWRQSYSHLANHSPPRRGVSRRG
jgi:hypothetical protein